MIFIDFSKNGLNFREAIIFEFWETGHSSFFPHSDTNGFCASPATVDFDPLCGNCTRKVCHWF